MDQQRQPQVDADSSKSQLADASDPDNNLSKEVKNQEPQEKIIPEIKPVPDPQPITTSQSKLAQPEIIAKKKAEDFRFGKLIGEGSYSSVYLAKEVKTGEEFAIKVCNKQHIIRERKTESIKREKEVMAILSGNRDPKIPFFVRLYATFQDPERLYFVMTYGRGGELLKYLHKVGSFDISCCRFYTGEIVLALAHLHNLSILHRDLKPENILLNDRGHILITDFGSAKILDKEKKDADSTTKQENEKNKDESGNVLKQRFARSQSFVGTAQYVSPEVLHGCYSGVGPGVDLWALGCILYQFVSGLPPFHGPNEYLIFQKITKLEYEFPPGFDKIAKTLVQSLLVLDPEGRLGVKDSERYKSIKTHPFFLGFDWENVHSQDAPVILPYLPSTNSGPALRSQISDSLEPGFNPRLIAERELQDDDDNFPNISWGGGSGVETNHHSTANNTIDSDDDEEEESISLTSELMEQFSLESSNQGAKNKKSSTTNPPVVTKYNLFPTSDTEKLKRLEEQKKNNPWHEIVNGNLILKQGLISKRKGLFSRRRMLLLTEGPHLYYCEPNRKIVKGEIPWSVTLKPEPKNFKIFFVHTPNRTYYLEDPAGESLEWCKAINEVHHKTYGDTKNIK